ncbi:MAG TPA: hypothetical protein VJ821_18535 [Anaerolineales bacterium]|nr:hypothetical protein [Anaerolineales bacterium]
MHRRRRGPGCLAIFFWAVLLIALGPSLVNLPRVWIACRVWENPPAEEPASPISDEAAIRGAVREIPDYYRPESKTYLTLPEWYIVYSTDEYADFIATNSSSDFPYFRAVGQYWQSYVDVCNEIRGRYPFNGDSQFTLAFIGMSFTAENMLKGVYEGTIGRLTDWISSDTPTEEELYAAQVAQEYGQFMHEIPWYFFPFQEKVQGLWNETSLWEPDPIRKWERKLALTIEYGGKMLFSAFTNFGAQATYGGADVEKIYAVTQGVTDDMVSTDLEVVEEIDGQRQLIRITRFEYFSDTVPGLLERSVRFEEIAGNDEILFTLLGPQDADYNFEYGEYLFDLPILTQPGQTRAAVRVRMEDMAQFFEELNGREDLRFEHMYDY